MQIQVRSTITGEGDKMLNDPIKSIDVKKDPSQLLGFSPATNKDWEKLDAIVNQVQIKWRQSDYKLDAFAGLYFGAIGYTGGLELRADHDTDISVPEKVNDYLNGIDVNLKKDGEKK